MVGKDKFVLLLNDALKGAISSFEASAQASCCIASDAPVGNVIRNYQGNGVNPGECCNANPTMVGVLNIVGAGL